MFDMDLAWWEFVARGTAVYGVLMVMVRMTGKRTVGQFTPFDLLVVMLLSEAVSNSLTGGDSSLGGGLIVAATLVALNLLMAYVSTRSRRAESLLEGTALLIGRDGRLFNNVIRRHRLGMGDVEQALREADCDLADMRCVFLETDGSVSVMTRKPQQQQQQQPQQQSPSAAG